MKFFIKTLEDIGVPLNKESKILDFGCGNGAHVKALQDAGFKNAVGCDLKFKTGPDVEALKEQNLLRVISSDPYRLPYDDNSFDYIISETVFEHVQNTHETLAEIARVLKPGGVTLHYFPSKYGVIESHIGVPFGSVFQSYAYLYFWALLGIRTKRQREDGLSARDVVERNIIYLKNSTHYLSTREIQEVFSQHFSEARFVEKIGIHNSTSRLTRLLAKLSWIPGLAWLYRTFKAVIIMSVK